MVRVVGFPGLSRVAFLPHAVKVKGIAIAIAKAISIEIVFSATCFMSDSHSRVLKARMPVFFKKKEIFLIFPHLLAVWVGDK